MKKTRDDICAPPNTSDILYGRIIYHNRIFDGNQLEMFLDELEDYNVIGAKFSLIDVVMEQNMLNPTQEIIIREAFKKQTLSTNDIFMKEALKFIPKAKAIIESYVSENQHDEKLPSHELLRIAGLPTRYYKILCCYMQHFWLSEENKILCNSLTKNGLLEKKKLNLLNVKYNRYIRLGNYKPLILLLDSFIAPNVLNLYLRAVRRSMMTNNSLEVYM